jgi:hypothetical protein
VEDLLHENGNDICHETVRSAVPAVWWASTRKFSAINPAVQTAIPRNDAGCAGLSSERRPPGRRRLRIQLERKGHELNEKRQFRICWRTICMFVVAAGANGHEKSRDQGSVAQLNECSPPFATGGSVSAMKVQRSQGTILT